MYTTNPKQKFWFKYSLQPDVLDKYVINISYLFMWTFISFKILYRPSRRNIDSNNLTLRVYWDHVRTWHVCIPNQKFMRTDILVARVENIQIPELNAIDTKDN